MTTTTTLLSWFAATGTAALFAALMFVKPAAHKFRGSHHETAIYDGGSR